MNNCNRHWSNWKCDTYFVTCLWFIGNWSKHLWNWMFSPLKWNALTWVKRGNVQVCCCKILSKFLVCPWALDPELRTTRPYYNLTPCLSWLHASLFSGRKPFFSHWIVKKVHVVALGKPFFTSETSTKRCEREKGECSIMQCLWLSFLKPYKICVCFVWTYVSVEMSFLC